MEVDLGAQASRLPDHEELEVESGEGEEDVPAVLSVEPVESIDDEIGEAMELTMVEKPLRAGSIPADDDEEPTDFIEGDID